MNFRSMIVLIFAISGGGVAVGQQPKTTCIDIKEKAPYDDDRNVLGGDIPCYDGRSPTLQEGDTCAVDDYTFSRADVYTCMAGPHAYIGIVLNYACLDGTTKNRRVVTGKNMVGDHTDFQNRPLSTCTLNGSITNPDQVEHFARRQAQIVCQSQTIGNQFCDSILAPICGIPCWKAAQACREALDVDTGTLWWYMK